MLPLTPRWAMIGFVIAIAALAVMCLLALTPAAAIDGPDIVIESLTTNPLIPAPGQPFSITIVTRNQGNVSTGASSFLNYVYLDPIDRPPTLTTTYTYRFGAGPLAAGGSSSFTRSNDPNLSFATAGCQHVIYAWADKTDLVAETVETNNVYSQTVCVGVTCQPDAFETDNTCAAANWLTNTQQISQPHTLCPVGDEDWVKFTTLAGVTYTLQATNLGLHADPLLYLYPSCSSAGQFGTGPSIVWRSPTSGAAYVRVVHRQATYGPLNNYALTLSANTTGLYDLYEPDNTCAAARDLPTDGTHQTHYFQASGDVDWVKFPIGSGQTAVLIADNTGPNVSPHVQVYNSCEQTFGEPIAYGPSAQVDSGSGGLFYAQIINQQTGTGPTAFYDVSLSLSGCTPDGAENDNTFAAAKLVPTTGVTQTHTTCPSGDQDWIKFNAISGTTYLLESSNLGAAADTELALYGSNGTTLLAENDDYTIGLLASRLIWQAPASGVYYAKIKHVNAAVAGPATRYDLAVSDGVCAPDVFESDAGDNTPATAITIPLDGSPQIHTFCPPGDQDWVRVVAASPGTTLTLRTVSPLISNDTVLNLFAADGNNVLAANDDYGAGGNSLISQTLPAAGTYYARVVPYNASQFGGQTTYQLIASAIAPPTPTPTPTPWPTPTPTATPVGADGEQGALIVVNPSRLTSVFGAVAATQIMSHVFELADQPRVNGLVIQVDTAPAVAAAYAAWTADAATLLDNDKANAVAQSIRNLMRPYLLLNQNIKHIVIVGDDRIIPFRRVPDRTDDPSVHEPTYALSLTLNTTAWSALNDNLTLTDNYYADLSPTMWARGELYLPDYGIGRLIETPDEIIGLIDNFLAAGGYKVERGLVTGYHFVQDSADRIKTTMQSDGLITDGSLIGYSWPGDTLRSLQLNTEPRFDLQSINGHANHTTQLTPDGDNITAAEVAAAVIDLSRAVIYTVGCHAGLNDPAALDLAQAFAGQGVNYVANTGYGWGSDGITYSEALMRNYTLMLLRGQSAELGPALSQAKQRYFSQTLSMDGYDEKIILEATLYGLPMAVITTGATFDEEDPFPSLALTTTAPPGAFGELTTGQLKAALPGSFGAFDAITNTGRGGFYALNGSVHTRSGEPLQPRFYADVSAPQAGVLRGVVFLGGVYTDRVGFDPVIARPVNEYVTSTIEPVFKSAGWYPPVPFDFTTHGVLTSSTAIVQTVLGQFNSQSGTERLYDQVALGTYFSGDADTQPPRITYLDGVMNTAQDRGLLKVEAADASGVVRVLATFTPGDGVWFSRDLTYSTQTLRWTGDITATATTRYFIQVVDGAGNVATAHNKGRYYALSPAGAPVNLNRVYLPVVRK